MILGHEYIGHVVEAGADAAHFRPGDRVAVIPDVACGRCRFCAEGRPNLCERMFSIGGDTDGGFAQYALAPAKALYPVSHDLPVEEGRSSSCSPACSAACRKQPCCPEKTW